MKVRLFLTCWIVFALHFATNIAREHYPAFALVDHGTFQCDDWAGLHPDIFEHDDGHWYIGNQVLCSVFVAVPLLVFDPLLDALEAHRKEQLARGGGESGEFESEYPMRRAFFEKVRARGLDLRLGAVAAITAVFVMAPLAAWLVVLVFGVLLQRGVPRGRALWLALLFAFGTPVFYRVATLNHNVFFTVAVLGSFLALWQRNGPVSPRRIFVAGLLAGTGLALDYAGAVTLLALFGYLLATQRDRWRGARTFVLGSLPPVLFLWFSQWAMFGNPFLPGQFWMPDQNEYVDEGMRGFTAPDLELLGLQFWAPGYGIAIYAPLLLLAFLPAWPRLWRGDRIDQVLPRRERRFVALLVAAFLVFCACNQYSRLQWNTGFRYLLPLVPLWWLALSDHLRRMPTWALAVITVPVVLHTWILTSVRYLNDGGGPIVAESWRRWCSEGVQFPWLNVMRSAPTVGWSVLHAWWLPYALLAAVALVLTPLWRGRSGAAAGR